MGRRVVFPTLLALVLVATALVWIPWDCRGPLERELGGSVTGMALADARACDDGDAIACVNLAVALETAEGTARNVLRATALYRDGCAAGLSLACVNLAVLALSDPGAGIPAAEADRLLEATCRGGDAIACLRFGDAIAAGQLPGRGVDTALHAWATACGALLMPACISIGRSLRDGRGVPVDLLAAHTHFATACAQGHPDGCREAATMVVRGLSPGDIAAAIDQLERACYAGEPEACDAGIEALSAGPAGDQSAAAARRSLLRERACSLGHTAHCAAQ